MNLKRPESSAGEGSDVLDFTAKKVKRCYGICPERWFTAKKITQANYDASQAMFEKLAEVNEGDYAALSNALSKAREYIQIAFRTQDPSQHVRTLSLFWEGQNGLASLNLWFDWITGGTGLYPSAKQYADIISKKLDVNMKIVEKVLLEEKNEDFEEDVRRSETDSQKKYGIKIMHYIFLLRELCNHWKNHREKFVFIEGVDLLKDISSQPYLHVVMLEQFGIADFPESIAISVRVGNTVVFENVSLSEGLAAVLQVTFAFNLLYGDQVDDIFNYLQRILAKFGPIDGARNKKNQLKKCFVDFQCTLGKLVLQENGGKVQRVFI